MNKVNLLGRLTKDPEVKYTTNNTVYVNFSIAVRKRFKTEDGVDADFINITAWNKTAEFISMYFKKGMQIALTGRIQVRNYDDKDGKKYITEVIAEEVYFVDTKIKGANTVTIPKNDFNIEVDTEEEYIEFME